MKNASLTHKKSRKLHFVILFTLVLVILTPIFSSAQTRMGVSATLGGGLFVAQEEELYLGISADFYPELGLHVDLSLIRLGLRAGLIYRKLETFYSGFYEDEEFTMTFLPTQIELLLAPFDAIQKKSFISPYFGVLAGAFIAIADNDETFPAFSAVLGSEMRLEPLINNFVW